MRHRECMRHLLYMRTRARVGEVIGVLEFWKNFWVWPAFCRWLEFAVNNTVELVQSKLKRVRLAWFYAAACNAPHRNR
jgi:hypothetical protein